MQYLVNHFTEIVRQKGLEHVTVDDLVNEITPKGRGVYCVKVLCIHSSFHMHVQISVYAPELGF